MKNNNIISLAGVLLFSAASLFIPQLSHAQVYWGQTNGTNDYSTGVNWVGGSVPTTSQTAAFSANGTQTVNFGATPTQPNSLTVGINSGTLTFNSSGALQTVVSVVNTMVLGTSSNADIIIQKTGAGNFTFRSAGSFTVGGTGGNSNTVTVKGTNVTSGSSGSIVIVGFDNSSGNTLNVKDGAKLTSTGGTIGRVNNSDNNKIHLSGAGTLWDVTGNPASANITLGINAGNDNNDLIVKDGAKISSAVPLNVYRGTVHLDAGEIDLNRSTNQALTFQADGRLRGQGTLKASTVQSTASGAIVEVGEGGFGALNATLTATNGWNNTNISLHLGIGNMTGSPVAGVNYDWLNVTGNFTFGGTLTIDLSSAVLPANYDFALINWTGTNGSYSNMAVNFTNGSALNYEYRTNGFYISLFSSLYWTADGSTLGGAGTWNTSGTNWSASETSVSGAAWDGTKTAIFTSNAATVTVGVVTAQKGILFATDGYTLNSGTLTLGGTNIAENAITANSGVTATINSVLDGVNGFTKAGSGTLTLGGDNTFSGGTAVSAGTLQLKASAGSALGNATSVTVGASATLLLSMSNQVNDLAAVTLSGGTIKRESGVSEVFGNLTVSSASTLDYGSGTIGTLTFGTYTPSSLLTVDNFFAGNKLVFSSDLTSTITNTNYFTFGNDFSYKWENSAFTITAIPETSAYVVVAGLVGLMLWRRAKRA